jgi:hypothetical protein
MAHPHLNKRCSNIELISRQRHLNRRIESVVLVASRKEAIGAVNHADLPSVEVELPLMQTIAHQSAGQSASSIHPLHPVALKLTDLA